MAKYKYTEKTLLGDWRIEVRKSMVHVGNIRKTPAGQYKFFKGPNNRLAPLFEEKDLDTLKQRIESLIS